LEIILETRKERVLNINVYLYIHKPICQYKKISTSGNWNAGDSDWPDAGGA